MTFTGSGGWTQPFAGNNINPVNWGSGYTFTLINADTGDEVGVVTSNSWFNYAKNNANEQIGWEATFDNLPPGNYKLKLKESVTPNDYRLYVGAWENVLNTEICNKTPAYKKHSEVRKFLNKNYPNYRRCGFLALPIGEMVGAHIDEGTYYLDKDRYHLSIQGQYKYFVGNEDIIVDAGTLLWFNNKMPHGTVNLGDETRITFVFDVPHG